MSRRGATLFELLTVVAILSVLVAATSVAYVKILQRGRITKARLFANSMLQACEVYRSDWKQYPLIGGIREFALDDLYRHVAEKSGRYGPYLMFKELKGEKYSTASRKKKRQLLLDPFPNGSGTNFYMYDAVIRFAGADLKWNNENDLVEYWCTHPNDPERRARIVAGVPEARHGKDGSVTPPPKPDLSMDEHVDYNPGGMGPRSRGRAEQIRFFSAGPDTMFGTDDDIFAKR